MNLFLGVHNNVDFVDLGNFIFRGCEWDNFSFNPAYPEGCLYVFHNSPGVGKT